ncbi:hypothetical protein F5Y19DRAFT_481697 [Xylariaceae sp. FL1651]|nr:hypothetical protein F5Y19DRAFT_481697 [Xylariaceae sp. FL1651]
MSSLAYFDQTHVTTPPSKTVPIHDLSVSSEAELVQELTCRPSFCQAIFFYYLCGCRTPEPFFCCQPQTHASIPAPQDLLHVNPCKHEKPSLVVTKVPIPCGSRIGNSEACTAEDPGATEFVREVDTAETLDLVVLDDYPHTDFRTILPAKADITLSLNDIVSQFQQSKKRRAAMSATAAPFIPRYDVCRISSASPQPSQNVWESVHKENSETVEGKKAAGLDVDAGKIRQNVEIKQAYDDKGPHDSSRVIQLNIDEEQTLYEATHSQEFEGGTRNEEDEVFDTESCTSTSNTSVEYEKAGSSISSPESIGELNVSDDLVSFWNWDGEREEHKPVDTTWTIASLLSKLRNRRG